MKDNAITDKIPEIIYFIFLKKLSFYRLLNIYCAIDSCMQNSWIKNLMTKFFILNCLKTWILPPGCNILISMIGFFLYKFYQRIAIFFILLGTLSLWLFSAPIVAYNLIEQLQNQYPVLDPATISIDKNSAILVLGAGDDVNVEENNRHTVSDIELNRLRYAAYLYKKTHLPIIVSGGYVNGSLDSEADLMANALNDNFNITNIIKEDGSTNTAEESKMMVPILKKHNFTKVYLITNAWHMPRSMALFKQQHINVTAAPMGYKVYDHRYSLLSYLPDMQALFTTKTAIHEYIGFLWIRLKNNG